MSYESTAQLCNRSLRLIGQETVADIEADGKIGETLRLLYPAVRNRILASGRWGFATTRAELALVVVENYTRFTYTYQMPEDPEVVKIVMLTDADGYEYPNMPFLIENDVLYTDMASPILVYTRLEEDVAKYPEHFVNALQLFLAYEMSYTLDGNVRNDLLGLAQVAYNQAMVKEQRNNRRLMARSTPWAAARYVRGVPGMRSTIDWGI